MTNFSKKLKGDWDTCDMVFHKESCNVLATPHLLLGRCAPVCIFGNKDQGLGLVSEAVAPKLHPALDSKVVTQSV